jgi:hypothetical protein
LIATYPEAIAEPKNVCPNTLDEARELLEKTTAAYKTVNDYAQK